MQELDKMFNRQRKYIVYLLGIYVLGAVFTTYDKIFQGLMLGTMFQLIYILVNGSKKQKVCRGSCRKVKR